MPPVKEHKKSLIIKALENPEYTWRTVAGIAKETGLDVQTVRGVIAASGKEIIQSKVPSENGEDLFTTHSQLKPLVMSALKNPKYTWRTIVGIATETRLAVQTVVEVIAACGAEVIKSNVPSDEGEELYRARSH